MKNLKLFITALFLPLTITLIPGSLAIGYNGKVDMLAGNNLNHKEEINSILNKRYKGDAAPTGKKADNSDDHEGRRLLKEDSEGLSSKARLMGSTNGYVVNKELENVVTNILEASEIVERESMFSSTKKE